MKKTLFLSLFVLFALFSCQDNGSSLNLKIGDGLNEMVFDVAEETKEIDIQSSISALSVFVDKGSANWCSAVIQGRKLKISVTRNDELNERKAVVTVKAGNSSVTLNVIQKPEDFVINEDIKLTIESGTASDFQNYPGEGPIELSFDGDLNTLYHSTWGRDANFPVILTYKLKDADVLDYIIYYPRTYGSNGRFGRIEVYVSTEANPSFVKVMDYDCGEKGTPSKIEFATPAQKVKEVQFKVLSGLGNFASCAEMEFYKKGAASTVKYVEIPVGAAGYMEPDKYAANSEAVMDLVYDPAVKAQGKVFFRFGKAGNASISLKLLNTTQNKKIKVSLGDFSKEINVPVTNGKYEWVDIEILKVTETAKYSVLIIENLDAGNVKIQSVRVAGEPSDGLYYPSSPELRRNAVSVHLGYQLSGQTNIEWFYNEMTVPVGFDKPYHSYYMANGWSRGYSGLQTRDLSGANSKRWLIYSCWNSRETSDSKYWAKVTKVGAGVQATSFGGEGTGAKTYLELDWESGKTYCFLLQARVSAVTTGNVSDTTFYSLFWKEKSAADWTFQATIMSPYNGTYLSGLYSFVENYIGFDGQYQRKAMYVNQWVKGSVGWSQLTSAKFTSDENIQYRQDVGAVVNGNGYYLWNGGFLPQEGTVGSILTRNSSTSGVPVSDAELVKLKTLSK